MTKKKKSYPRPEKLETGWSEPSNKKLTIDNIRTVEECDRYVSYVFGAVCELHGEKEAQRIFAEYSKPPVKREVKSDEDASLLIEYLWLFLDVDDTEGSNIAKPNVRQYAHEQAIVRGVDPDSMERKVWRVLDDERVWAKLAEDGFLHCPWPNPGLLEVSEDRRKFASCWGLLPVKK
jgi:hypothetical protein